MSDSDEIKDEAVDESTVDVPAEEEQTWGDRLLSPDRPLSPRHRRLAELLAQGKKNGEIAKELGITESRISVLKSNTRIRELAEDLAERIFEESVIGRLRKLNEPALNEIEKCLTDRTHRYKEQLRVDTAKWLIEMNHGKAKQTHDIGENMLSVMMDRLDALKQTGKTLENAARDVIDLSPTLQIEGSVAEIDVKEGAEVEDPLKKWVSEFTSLQKT